MNEPGLDGSFWPSESQKLLLRTAFGGDAAGAAWERARPTLDLDRLEIGSFPLLPLVHRKLERLGIDDPYLPRLAGIRRRTWYLNTVRAGRAAAALYVLEAAGVRPVVVDGWSAVARGHGGDLTVRAVDGLDVIVPPDRTGHAEQALRRAGYERQDDWLPDERRLAGRDGDACALHTRLAREFAEPSPGDVAAETAPAELAGAAIRVLRPDDELVRLCLVGARATRLPAVLWVADALALLRSSGDEVDWARIQQQADLLRAALRLHDALLYLGREHGAAVPPETVEALAAAASRPRERLAHRLAGRSLPGVGPAPRTAVRFLHVTSDRPLATALAAGPRFLRDELGVPRSRLLPRELGRRARTALRLQRVDRRRAAAPERQGAA
jgi:putative nucleotidyltransferase-like protein